jgi:hypothetical protein
LLRLSQVLTEWPDGRHVDNHREAVLIPAVLIWGATTPVGCEAIRSTFGFADVLSIEEMLGDLRGWQCESWITRVTEVGGWCAELTEFLGGGTHEGP